MFPNSKIVIRAITVVVPDIIGLKVVGIPLVSIDKIAVDELSELLTWPYLSTNDKYKSGR